MEISLLYLAIGAFGGLIIGFIGTGSSMVILPALSLVFPLIFPHALAFRLAVGTCAATISIGAFVGAFVYIRQGLLNKRILIFAIPTTIIALIIGSLLSSFMPEHLLRLYIALFIFLTATYKLISFRKKNELRLKKATFIPVSIAAFFSSFASSIAGVAIGITFMPFLHRYLPHKETVGTSITLAAIYAPFTAIAYIIIGLHAHVNAPHTLGYVYLPAFILLAISSTIFVPVGAKLAAKVPGELAKKGFYCFLLIASIVIATT